MKKGPHKMMLESSRYDKWAGGGGGAGGAGGGGGGGGAGGPSGAWAGRDRERDRERERQARAHQMAHAPEPDASSLFPAPFRVTGNKDRVSQQIQIKLGDYHLAQTLLDDPSKSIGICAEPPSPAPCAPSRRESEFKKPAHAPQNGRVHHRPYYKSEAPGSTTQPPHRPPPLRIPNGVQHQNAIDSSQPPIESILKEMKSLPTPLSVIAATPRKELENKFIFNPYTNKVQENPQLASNDLKAPLIKPAAPLDNRIPDSRNSVSPDVVGKDLGLSESDDDGAATTTRLHPILSPLGSGGSASSGSESSASDSESESSSTESSSHQAAAPVAVAAAPTARSSWSLSNFAPPAPQHPQHPQHPPDPQYDDAKDLAHALADGKGKPSPISELSDSSASSGSAGGGKGGGGGGGGGRRRGARAPSSDDDQRTSTTAPSPRVQAAAVHAPAPKRGRPPKARASEERPAKKKRGRPPKPRPASPASPASLPSPPSPPSPPPKRSTSRSRSPGSSSETEERNERSSERGRERGAPPALAPAPAPPPPAQPLLDMKSHIFRKVFTPKKGDEGGGKGGKGGKGKGGKGKGQVTIIEVTAPESADEKRKNEEAIAERLSPPTVVEPPRRRDEREEREQRSERSSSERSAERLPPDRRPPLQPPLQEKRLERIERLTERLPEPPLQEKRLERLERAERLAERPAERYVKAEADVGVVKSERSERLVEPCSIGPMRRSRPPRLLVRVPLSRLRGATLRALRAPRAPPQPPAPPPQPATPTHDQSSALATNHERGGALGNALGGPISSGGSGQTPIYYSYFERLPPDARADDERDHKYYLGEATRLRTAAEREQEPLSRVMLYLESVLCFVLTGRVLELELDTKQAFTIYRETIEYIKSIHSMPQRYRAPASPHSTFSKLDILSLRVQALLYLRMFKMYNREVKEYYKIVQDYQQKPASAESVSPLSPTPSPAGSVGSVGSGSASSGYYSLAHSVPAQTHNALLQLTKYYTFLYVAHELWEQADCLCRLRPNQDLFIAVDRRCGPLTLFSTFRHLVQYVRYAISLLKHAPRE